MSKFFLIQAASLIVLTLNYQVAHADVSSASAALKSCLVNNLPDEKRKKRPRESVLMSKCQSEYTALLAVLPPGAEKEVRHALKHQIKAELRKQ